MRLKNLLPLALAAVLAHIALTWIRAIQRGAAARLRDQSRAAAPDLATPQPPVSILVPAWQERGIIEKCIRSLQAIDYPAWEALILAGGSDGTYQKACQLVNGDSRFRVIERGPEPKNVALTKGVEAAQHDALVILDADSVVEPGWLRALMAPLAAGAAASFGMHYPSVQTWISLAEHMDILQAYHIAGSQFAQGCSSLAVWRDKLEQIGPLPANAFSWEDWDIDVKLIAAGHRIVFAPHARLITDRPTSLGEYWQSILRSYRSHIAGVWHHRHLFARQPAWGVAELFFLGYGAVTSMAALVGIFMAVIRSSNAPVVAASMALFTLWTMGRRASLGAELAAYTDDNRWIKRAWYLVVLLPVQFAGALLAVASFWKQPSFDYKGVRPVKSS